jgi:uncharacterized protein (DUF1015 family)
MSLIRPFGGLYATPEPAAQIAAPPFNVLSDTEARIRATGKPLNFLHISRADIDLALDLNPYDDSVYQQARLSGTGKSRAFRFLTLMLGLE